MLLNVLCAETEANWPKWKSHLTNALGDLKVDARVHRNFEDHAADVIVYSPKSGLDDFRPFTRLQAVLSTWAGVERITPNPTLTVPLTRMVDPGLTKGMVEYCLGHILRYHLNLDAHSGRTDTRWQPELMPPLASSRRVGVLGLGALGQAVAEAARDLGFDVSGWSRSEKLVDGVTCLHGNPGFRQVLSRSEILITLLPLTDATHNILGSDAFSAMPEGACIVNPGRGPLIVDEDLVAALDQGQIGHATLDVFRIEPLPEDHIFWRHPNVTVTPHIAAETRVETASLVIADNIARVARGEPLKYLVDRATGY